MASDGSTVVEYLSHHLKVTGLSLATAFGTRRGKMAKNLFLHFHKKTNNMVIKVSSCFVASDGSTVVEHLSHRSKVTGLSLALPLAPEEEKWQQITFS